MEKQKCLANNGEIFGGKLEEKQNKILLMIFVNLAV